GQPGFATPAGTVTFDVNGVPAAQETLSGGVAQFLPSTPLAVGSDTITAFYGGAGAYTPSDNTAAPLIQTVNQDSTTTTVASSTPSSVFGQLVTFTATVGVVSPGAGKPSGTVTFYDGGTQIGTGTLNSSDQATFTTSTLSIATQSITAVYGGDSNDLGSTSGAVSQVVSKDATATSLASSVNPSVFGQSVTFTATVGVVSPGAGKPSGTVTFYDGGTQIGTGTLNSSDQATFTTSTLSIATQSITAVYGGDSNDLGSTSGAVSQVVSKDGTTTSLVSSVNPSVFGQSVTFTATVGVVSPGAGKPSGTVTFYDGGTQIGTGTLNSSELATFTTSTLSIPTQSITSVYGGDSNDLGSTSGVLTQTVNQDATTTTITASTTSPSFGQTVTLTARTTANAPGSGTPTGSVSFVDLTTGNTLGSGALSGGVASLTISTLEPGGHSIEAIYSGDGDFLGSTSSQNVAITAGNALYVLSPSASGALEVTGGAGINEPGPLYVDSSSASA